MGSLEPPRGFAVSNNEQAYTVELETHREIGGVVAVSCHGGTVHSDQSAGRMTLRLALVDVQRGMFSGEKLANAWSGDRVLGTPSVSLEAARKPRVPVAYMQHIGSRP
jgi:hypothetical protein